MAREPYAAAGGGALPGDLVTELRVTPFDDLIYDDEEASVARTLPGKVIGFDIWTRDTTILPGIDHLIFLLLSESEMRSRADAASSLTDC